MSTPAVEVRSFQVTIPAGTPQTSPYTQDIFFPVREVVQVHWKVPPGPSGLMGWRLTMSGGNAVIPTGGGWIVADGEDATWPFEGLPDSGAWEVTGYNTDIYDHTVYLDFLLALVGGSGGLTTFVSNEAISNPAPQTVSTVTAPAPVTVTSVTAPAAATVTTVTAPAPVTVTSVTAPPPATVPFVSTGG